MTIEFIKQIAEKNHVDAPKTFKTLLGEKIGTALQQKRLEVAEAMDFEEDYLSEEEIDQLVESLTDEDVAALGEQFELAEISKATLGSYVKKASKKAADHQELMHGDAVHGDKQGAQYNYKRMKKRKKGVHKAIDKLTKEESEQVSEVSKATLSSYVKKAAHDIDRKSSDLEHRQTPGQIDRKGSFDARSNLRHKMRKRHKGIAKAVDKLSK